MQGCEPEDCFKECLDLNPNQDNNNKWSDDLLFIQSIYNCSQQFDLQPNVEKHEDLPPVHLQEILFGSLSAIESKVGKQQQKEFQDSNTEDKIKDMDSKIKKITGCKCKKTQCLKSYCQCYSGGKYCSDGCGCMGCKNSYDNKQLVQVTKNRQKGKSSKGDHQCQCKKSKCQKKYCQCFNAGGKCGIYCKCTQCQNKESPVSQQN